MNGTCVPLNIIRSIRDVVIWPFTQRVTLHQICRQHHTLFSSLSLQF